MKTFRSATGGGVASDGKKTQISDVMFLGTMDF